MREAGALTCAPRTATHLATALAVMEADSVFVTWDKRLRQAALQAGLVTAPA